MQGGQNLIDTSLCEEEILISLDIWTYPNCMLLLYWQMDNA